MAARKPVAPEQQRNLRAELEHLFEQANSPEEFLHVLFSFLSELTARDVGHPVVQSLAKELGRAAAQPITHAYVHDLGNVLMAILNNLEALGTDVRSVLGGEVPEQSRARVIADVFAALDDVREALRRGLEMTADARSLNFEGERGRTDLAPLLDSLIRMSRRANRNAAIELVKAPDAIVRAPRVAAHRVLANLIQNACDAVMGREDGRVDVEAWTSDVDVFVQVADNGPGIDPKLHEEIFDLFYTTKSYGSGVGLFVCRALVHGWGGYMQVDSRPGQGARFTFSIPRSDPQ